MARQSDILLGPQAFASAGEFAQLAPMYGGNFAWAPNPSEWNSAQGYVPRNLIPIVLESPRFFSVMPNPDKWVEAWRVFIEKHARTIEGLKAGLTVEKAEHQYSGGGEFFEEFVDVKRERSSLSVGMADKYGNVWQSFLEKWIMWGMMHPDTKTPLSVTLADGPTDLLADWYAGAIAFIEPTPDGRRAMKTWLSVNVWPQGTGPIEGKMDKTSALSLRDLSIDLTSLTFYNDGTRAIGQNLLDAVVYTNANPVNMQGAITEISADVAAVTKSYQESAQTIVSGQVA